MLMSKKIISILLTIILIFSLSACSKGGTTITDDGVGSISGSQTESNQDDKQENMEDEKPYGNYTNSFQFTGSDEDYTSDKYKQANFQKLYLTTSSAYGIQEITLSNALYNTKLNDYKTELIHTGITAKKGDALLEKIAKCQDFTVEYSLEAEFTKSLIPISSEIKVRPYNVSKQGENKPQAITIDFVDSKMTAKSEYFKSITFKYNEFIKIENQEGKFILTFDISNSKDAFIMPFGGNTKTVTVEGVSNVRSNLTFSYKDGKVILTSDNPEFNIPSLKVSISMIDGMNTRTLNYGDTTNKQTFTIEPIEDQLANFS